MEKQSNQSAVETQSNQKKITKNRKKVNRYQVIVGLSVMIASLIMMGATIFLFLNGDVDAILGMYIGFAIFVLGIELVLVRKPILLGGWTLVVTLLPAFYMSGKAFLMNSFTIGKLPGILSIVNCVLIVGLVALTVMIRISRKR